MAGPFKMKGSPMQRNFGIGSPLNDGQKTKGKLKKTLIGPIKPMTDKDNDGIPVGVDSDDNKASSAANTAVSGLATGGASNKKIQPKKDKIKTTNKTKSKPVEKNKVYKTIQIDPTAKPPGFWSRS